MESISRPYPCDRGRIQTNHVPKMHCSSYVKVIYMIHTNIVCIVMQWTYTWAMYLCFMLLLYWTNINISENGQILSQMWGNIIAKWWTMHTLKMYYNSAKLLKSSYQKITNVTKYFFLPWMCAILITYFLGTFSAVCCYCYKVD